MGMATSFDPNGKPVEISISPKNPFCPAVITLRTEGYSVQLHLRDEIIAELAYLVNTHIDNIEYPQPVLPAEKEEIA
ncbi:hypothetical protein C2I18_14180 [Paenibacillus sp. PK3_47]|uniref:hypothetical protein n=1 Tax=Paenibacillus sp. PK3_47 TaxID=2072642 RepID=UPI00201E4843|nr:hypothetical protein [Paenibacillus sp. PK3_47]UQZ34566.1 hypothetical protein C2I18_14180 [Paenibacillus sp. PK3_47]